MKEGVLNTLWWNCFQTRRGEGEASSTRPHPVALRQKWMTGGHWGSIAKGAYTLAVYIHTERLKAVSGTPNQCNRLSANSKGVSGGAESRML